MLLYSLILNLVQEKLYANFIFCFSFWGLCSQTPYLGFAPGYQWESSIPQAPWLSLVFRKFLIHPCDPLLHCKILGMPVPSVLVRREILQPFSEDFVSNVDKDSRLKAKHKDCRPCRNLLIIVIIHEAPCVIGDWLSFHTVNFILVLICVSLGRFTTLVIGLMPI